MAGSGGELEELEAEFDVDSVNVGDECGGDDDVGVMLSLVCAWIFSRGR